MKKIALLTLTLYTFCALASVQTVVQRGDNLLSLGAGFGIVHINARASLVPMSLIAKYQVGVKRLGAGLFTLGASFGFGRVAEDADESYFFYHPFNCEYHYDWKQQRFDSYLGLMLGPGLFLADIGDVAMKQPFPWIAYRIYMGVSYTLSKKIGLYAELGIGAPIFSVGLIFNFNSRNKKSKKLKTD